VWRFYRFLQSHFGQLRLEIPRAVAGVLTRDRELLKQYRAINNFYGRLTNPLIYMPVDVLIGSTDSLDQLAKKHGARRAAIAFLPPSTSRETELFDRLFPQGVPAGVNLMAELIRRIRSGEVDLAPGEEDGWYQYQVFALETMLLPSQGQENEKLLLTAKYKRRLIDAFKALITKRRETHARQLLDEGFADAPLEEGEVCPRLRVEPLPTFYLRTARAYGFLGNFLRATIGTDRLSEMHGLRRGGKREAGLAAELDAIRRRFYGFYLVSCEDIGMKPSFMRDEPVDREAAERAALAWIANIQNDPDLACDTRVSVPIYTDGTETRLWAALGVRLAHLEASYARPPKVRPARALRGEWTDVKPYQLGTSKYVIPVDEFAEITLAGSNALTREELRAVCDRCKTKEDILVALAGYGRQSAEQGEKRD